jgi:hypothetical protein
MILNPQIFQGSEIQLNKQNLYPSVLAVVETQPLDYSLNKHKHKLNHKRKHLSQSKKRALKSHSKILQKILQLQISLTRMNQLVSLKQAASSALNHKAFSDKTLPAIFLEQLTLKKESNLKHSTLLVKDHYIKIRPPQRKQLSQKKKHHQKSR